MYQNNLSAVTAVPVPEEILKELIMELAGSRGIDAWLKKEGCGKVILGCGDKETSVLLKAASSVVWLLRARRLETLAEAIVFVGGKPSAALLEKLEVAQEYTLWQRWTGCDNNAC